MAPKKSTAVTFDWTSYLLTLDSDELFFPYVKTSFVPRIG